MRGIEVRASTIYIGYRSMLFSSTISWLVQIPESAAQRFYFPFIFNLLTIGEFECLQNFFHVNQRAAQFVRDEIHLVDGLGNAGMLLGWWKRFLR